MPDWSTGYELTWDGYWMPDQSTDRELAWDGY